MLKLYGYWRSSAAYRVRIALNLKGVPYEQVPIHLLDGGGQQHGAAYRALNPQGLLPLLVDEENGGVRIAQSLAILEYLEEIFPVPPLLPGDPAERARARALAMHIACDIHPLGNLRVLQYLSRELGVGDEAKQAWVRHWITTGLAAVEQGLESFPVGRPGYLEACVIAQLYNARRYGCDLSAFTRLLAMAARCESLPAFVAALPENQPDQAV